MYSLELSVYFFYLKKITVRFQIEYIPAYLSNRKRIKKRNKNQNIDVCGHAF